MADTGAQIMTEANQADALTKALTDIAAFEAPSHMHPANVSACMREIASKALSASALATPASDGLPEGWKGIAAERGDDLWLRKAQDTWDAYTNGGTCCDAIGPATMSLSEACLAANERFPVVKPEAKWVQTRADRWDRSDGIFVERIATDRWVVFDPRLARLPVFSTAEEAMAQHPPAPERAGFSEQVTARPVDASRGR